MPENTNVSNTVFNGTGVCITESIPSSESSDIIKNSVFTSNIRLPSSSSAIAEGWYNPDSIYSSIVREIRPSIPPDTRSREFAEWLCGEYRLAMAKGIDIGRSLARSEHA